MQVVIRQRALNAIIKVALYIENKNTPGSGERWADKLKAAINSLAKSKTKLTICKHPSLARFKYRCYAYKNWVIAFKVSDKEFEVCRFIYGARLV